MLKEQNMAHQITSTDSDVISKLHVPTMMIALYVLIICKSKYVLKMLVVCPTPGYLWNYYCKEAIFPFVQLQLIANTDAFVSKCYACWCNLYKLR